jgi:hypothetical protein
MPSIEGDCGNVEALGNFCFVVFPKAKYDVSYDINHCPPFDDLDSPAEEFALWSSFL